MREHDSRDDHRAAHRLIPAQGLAEDQRAERHAHERREIRDR
jgi:hypothetical protein